MLAIQANYHDGQIQIAAAGLPRDAKVVVLFLDAEPENPITSLSLDQQASLHLQSQSNFAKSDLLNPAEDCWNDV